MGEDRKVSVAGLSFRFQADADLNPEIGRGCGGVSQQLTFAARRALSQTAHPIESFFRSLPRLASFS